MNRYFIFFIGNKYKNVKEFKEIYNPQQVIKKKTKSDLNSEILKKLLSYLYSDKDPTFNVKIMKLIDNLCLPNSELKNKALLHRPTFKMKQKYFKKILW